MIAFMGHSTHSVWTELFIASLILIPLIVACWEAISWIVNNFEVALFVAGIGLLACALGMLLFLVLP